MTKRLHVFNCYRYDVAERVVVRAVSHEAAARIAARLRGWTESEVVTRYVKTIYVDVKQANAA